MSVGQGQAYEAHFGPVSEIIDISQFLELVKTPSSASDHPPSSLLTQSSRDIPGPARTKWLEVPEERRKAIEDECSVGDIQHALNDVISNPRLNAYVTRTHDASVQSVYETAEMNKTKKRKRVTVLDPEDEASEVTQLREQLDSVQLKSWPLYMTGALFIRTPKNSDSNTLIATKRLAFKPAVEDPNQALIFVTIYDRLQWGHRLLARSSQHVLLSSETLGDLMDSIPCVSKEIPRDETEETREITEQDGRPANSATGALMCLENVVHGNGYEDYDYVENILEFLKAISDGEIPVAKGLDMHQVSWNILKVRLHKPCWLIHAGDCEHYFTVDQIRLHHPSDPPLADFPLTTQITPPLLDVCRACNRAPAVYSILGDIRLGESPFVICGPCWRWMGMPKDDQAQQVTVVPLPPHKLGWEV